MEVISEDGDQEPQPETTASPLIKKFRDAIINLDSRAVGEILSQAPFLAGASLDQTKFHNALHELVHQYTDSEKLNAHEDFTKILKVLTDHEIDLNETDVHGNTALMTLCDRPGFTEAIEALCSAKCDLDMTNGTGQTALNKAVQGGYEPDIQCLLDFGANPNVMDKMGMGPLHQSLARKRGCSIAKQLITSGAFVDLQDEKIGGPAPLHVAVRMTNADGTLALLELGAQPDPVNSAGQTPLHLAAQHDFTGRCGKILIENKADINARDALYEETALHKSVKLGIVSMTEALVEGGADTDQQDCMGNSALHVAAVRSRDIHVWNMLLMNGSGGSLVRNLRGDTALTIAKRSKNAEAEAALKQYFPQW